MAYAAFDNISKNNLICEPFSGKIDEFLKLNKRKQQLQELIQIHQQKQLPKQEIETIIKNKQSIPQLLYDLRLIQQDLNLKRQKVNSQITTVKEKNQLKSLYNDLHNLNVGITRNNDKEQQLIYLNLSQSEKQKQEKLQTQYQSELKIINQKLIILNNDEEIKQYYEKINEENKRIMIKKQEEDIKRHNEEKKRYEEYIRIQENKELIKKNERQQSEAFGDISSIITEHFSNMKNNILKMEEKLQQHKELEEQKLANYSKTETIMGNKIRMCYLDKCYKINIENDGVSIFNEPNITLSRL